MVRKKEKIYVGESKADVGLRSLAFSRVRTKEGEKQMNNRRELRVVYNVS